MASKIKVAVSWRTRVTFEVEGDQLEVGERVRATPIDKLASVFEGTEWLFLIGPSYWFEEVRARDE